MSVLTTRSPDNNNHALTQIAHCDVAVLSIVLSLIQTREVSPGKDMDSIHEIQTTLFQG